MTERARARRRIAAGALSLSALGWAVHLAAPTHAADPAFCRSSGSAGALPSLHGFVEPSQIGSLAMGWALMLIAMMVPTLIAPVLHVHQRSFRQRRSRAIALFAIGYGAVWMLAGAVLTLVQLMLSAAAAQSMWAAIAAAGLALAWQCSPAKQLCLNRSHNHSELSAFGLAADRDALGFGISHGVWCVGACWALMLVPMLLVHGHSVAMLAAMIVMVGERLEGPRPLRWRLRGLGKPMRIALARASSMRALIRGLGAAQARSRA